MDIQKLKELVKAALKDGTFVLDTKKLESPAIDLLADSYIPDHTLVLVPDPVNPIIEPVDGKSIIVKGTGVNLPIKDMGVEVSFYIETDLAALFLKATGNQSWNMEQEIPDFEETILSSMVFVSNALSPSFYLLSNKKDGLDAGLTFKGDVDYKKMTVGISALLGIENQELSGKVILKKGGVEFDSMDLKAPEIKHVNLWLSNDCTVQFAVQTIGLENPFSKVKNALPFINLTTKIPFSGNGGKQYEIPLSVMIVNWKSSIRFNADISQLIDASIEALGAFLNCPQIINTVPADYSPGTNLTFSKLYFDVNPEGTSIKNVGAQLGSQNPWEILKVQSTGKTLNAVDMKLDFMVSDPFSNPKPYLTLVGGVQLTDRATMMISASYPNFTVMGYLTDGSVLSIREFIEQFIGPCAQVPQLDITLLYFYLQSNNYSFKLNLNLFWNINPDQNTSLIVNSLGFDLAYTNSKLSAGFTGSFSIASINILVTADYGKTADNAWEFTGKTGKGQTIPIGEFINYLTNTFGIGDSPEWMRKSTLQDLDTSFNTGNKNFRFEITATIPIAANDKLDITLGFKLTSVEGGYQKEYSGTLKVHNSIFKLIFTQNPSNSTIEADWKATDETDYLQFADLAAAFGFTDIPDIPKEFDLALDQAHLFYDFTTDKEALVISIHSANYGAAVFVAQKIDKKWTYLFGLNVDLSNKGVNLANLPLVGTDIEKMVGPIGLNNIQLILAISILTAEQVKAMNKLILEHAVPDCPKIPEMKEGIVPGAYAALSLDLGKDNTYEIELNTAGTSTTKQEALLALNDENSELSIHWQNLQKKIGPVYFDKAGVAYQDGRLYLILNASLMLTALQIGLIELGVGNPFTSIDPDFTLSGLTISFKSGPVNISGGFLAKKIDGLTQYFGTATISLKSFNLSALGSYASVNGEPSLFIFALLTSPPLGGLPYFFITGVAAGFGYNRGLKLPAIDDVASFPLTQGFVPGQTSPFSGNDPNAALDVLIKDNVVPVQIGQYWLAAGVQFSSFQIVKSYALLVVEFGTQLEIGLIGMSTISMPPESKNAIAKAQLALSVRILPDAGIVSIEGKLTPASYILSTSCQLTGGFAFYTWFAPSKFAGDFVVTLGGYHPSFTPPAHYPKVPRLGFNWVVTKEVSIKGGMYFALTPSCIMAGGSLEATFISGNLKAWFNMGANFIIGWKPFFYKADMYINFGVSYTFKLNLLFATITKTISVSLGADLSIWGPDFTGVAHIHLWIISFSISFGASASAKVKPISWEEFKTSFLPQEVMKAPQQRHLNALKVENVITDTYCNGKVLRGLVEDLSVEEHHDPLMDWIVNRNKTTLSTETIIPSKAYQIEISYLKNGEKIVLPQDQLIYVNKAELDARNTDFGVGMVDVKPENFESKHKVSLQFDGELNPEIKYSVRAILGAVPKSMWLNGKVEYTKDATLKNVLIGFEITPLAPDPDASLPIKMEYFQYNYSLFKGKLIPSKPNFIPGPNLPDPMGVMQRTIADTKVTETRNNILAALKNQGVLDPVTVNVEQIAKSGNDFLLAPPKLQYTYWQKTA